MGVTVFWPSHKQAYISIAKNNTFLRVIISEVSFWYCGMLCKQYIALTFFQMLGKKTSLISIVILRGKDCNRVKWLRQTKIKNHESHWKCLKIGPIRLSSWLKKSDARFTRDGSSTRSHTHLNSCSCSSNPKSFVFDTSFCCLRDNSISKIKDRNE